ncbi:hypothetical protein [Serratia phage vB_SmaM_Yaphecito]|uniref:Stringent starvation protein B n=1 Tax=Serratia phage vB_SmaM_Yaphecito TaxID=2777368 RepID=A0A7T3NC19_9CAUD|nr:hypothetical protein [Serratia phage vB_SmaM_Yaphecito]
MICVNQYVFNAYYSYLSENGDGRVHMFVMKEGIKNPRLLPYVNKDYLVLNISGRACPEMRVEATGINFKASFGGVPLTDFLSWNHIAFMAAPNNPELGILPLPHPVQWVDNEPATELGALDKSETVPTSELSKINNYVPMGRSIERKERPNPFSVIKGGKE